MSAEGDRIRRNATILGAVPYVSAATPFYAGAKAKDGRKLATGGRVYGRQAVEALGGALPGAVLGAMGARKGSPRMMLAGYGLAGAGGLAGSAHGANRAVRNAQKRGDIKKSGSLSLVELAEISKSFRG